MQRKHIVAIVLLCALFGLVGCGQALQLPAPNSAAQSLPTATRGVPTTNDPPPAETVAAEPGNNAAEPAVTTPADNNDPQTVVSPPPAVETAPTPTVDPVFADAQLPSLQERWRYVQVERVPLDGIQTYTSTSQRLLWWYDPVFGQPIVLGQIQGDFPVQATFRFRGQEANALEVPYQVNQSFGITLPPAIVERIKNAGYGDWIEAFVYKTDDIQPR